jgi:hypothetical protein
MNWLSQPKKGPNHTGEELQIELLGGKDVELEEALKDFRAGMHAWSEAAYRRPHTISRQIRHRSWRLVTGWALGCMLLAGSVSGLVFEQHQRRQARIAVVQRAAEQARQLAEREARARVSDEVLLAGVDSDVSRQVPSAMEPLAQLMEENPQ